MKACRFLLNSISLLSRKNVYGGESLYYYEELTMKEIGKVLEITESRVSQIHTKAILHLRTKLKILQEE